MQRSYEVMFIVRPDLGDEDVDKLVATLESNVTAAGATLTNTERLGKRRLAYLIGKFGDGNYVLFHVEGPGAAIAEVERRLRVSEPVIKYLTVRVDLKQKRLSKMQNLRAQRVRRPAEPAAAPAPAPAPATGGEAPAGV